MLGSNIQKSCTRTLFGKGRASARARLLPFWVQHTRDEQGSLAIFGLFTFVIIIVLAGMGIDIVRQETLRSELQNTLDRAVLAATNLDNTNDPTLVIEDYFAKAGLSEYLKNVDPVTKGDSRKITATVEATIPTYFMKFADVPTLSLKSESVAEQGLSGLEISLVLDVSGSMTKYSRLTNLKVAAKEFTQTIFTNAESDEVMISVVPYATQVNAGDGILSKLHLSNSHSKSHCINFTASDFETVALEYIDDGATRYYDQTMHFDAFSRNWSDLDMGLVSETCAPEAAREILPFSNDHAKIDAFVNALQGYGNTSIDLGMKWGAALLDKSAQNISGTSQPAAAADAQKYIVVMTDGSHTNQYYIPDPYRDDGETTGVFKDKTGYVYVRENRRICNSYTCWYEPRYTRISDNQVLTDMPYPYPSDNLRQLTWSEVWSTMTVYNHAYARYLASNNSNTYYSWRNATRVSYDTATKDARLLKICDAAKKSGVIIFAIGFEAPEAGQQVMQSCASSDGHYYDVDGVEISEAFSAIAAKITELRLVR